MFQLASANAISWIQACLVMAGLIGAVMVAHDRSVRELGGAGLDPAAVRRPRPLVAYTVGWLALPLGS